MGDIEYLSIKEFDGKLRKNEGVLSATGTLATLTANSGKDMYIARAKCVFFSNTASTGTSGSAKIELQVNGIVVESLRTFLVMVAGSQQMLTFEYEFKNIGHKVAATQVIKLEVTAMPTTIDVEGFIECFEETTGETPQIPPLQPV